MYLIDNTTIFTNDPQHGVLNHHAVLIKGNQIAEVGKAQALKEKYPDCSRINGKGRLLMPGLVNAHMHFYSTFARGIALSNQPQNFGEILEMLWWKLDRALNPESIYYSALIPAIAGVKKGITSVIDHHASPNAVAGSLDCIEEALLQVGVRGVLCYEVSDRDGKAIAEQGLLENERYILKCKAAQQKDPTHLMDAMFGLHASFTLEDDTLQQAGIRAHALQKGHHIHVAEDPQDARLTQEKYHWGLVERLSEFGILGKQTLAAHGIHLTQAEKEILAQSGTMVVHNPQSNMNNAVGRTDIFDYLQRNVLLGIGTDGMNPDIRPDVRTALWLQKHDLHDNTVGWAETETMTLTNNPAIMERVSGQKVGTVAAGYLADLILIDYYPPTPLTAENFWGHFLFGICEAPVDTTFINGKLVMENQKLLTVDEATIAQEAQLHAQQVWEHFNG